MTTTDRKAKALSTGRLRRLASLARAGLGTAASAIAGSSGALEDAVEHLGELRGLGTKVGQMAGLLEASLSPDVREKVGPALARLRAQAVRSRWEDVARTIEEDLGGPPDRVFDRFEREPLASASLGQVHEAVFRGQRLAVKIQHPGIDVAFSNDLSNVSSLGRVATAFVMPRENGAAFVEGVKATFLAELDYVREAENLRTFARLTEGDSDLEVPAVVDERSSRRVLSTTFLRGEPVEAACDYPEATKRRQVSAIRRLLFSAVADHGLLYADAHAGNFFFRDDGTVGVLDFGSVVRLDDERRLAFARLRDAAGARDRSAFGRAVGELYGIDNPRAREAIADVQWISVGGLVCGEAIGDERIRAITSAVGEMKNRLLRERFALPSFVPFFMRTMLATNVLFAKLRAPESGALTNLGAA